MSSKAKTAIFILAVFFALLLTAAYYMKASLEQAAREKKEEIKKIEKKIAPAKADLPRKKEKFTTEDEIRVEYGKIEIVYLWNGKSFTGAVLSTDEIYTIVTVNGTMRIPIKDVKMREMIR